MSQSGALSSGGSGGLVTETLTGNVGGPVGPDGAFNINITANTVMGITTVGNPGTHTINIVASQASTTQLGTIQLATNAEAIAGTDTAKAITADDLKAKLGTQTLNGLPIGGGSGGAFTWTADPADGQLLIGFGGASPVLGTLTAGVGISIANAPGSITITNTGGAALSYTPVNTTPYVVLPGDQFISVDSSGAPITIELPNAPSTGRVFVIKDRLGTAATNNITITTVGGVVTIDGATSRLIILNFESLNLLFDGTGYQVY